MRAIGWSFLPLSNLLFVASLFASSPQAEPPITKELALKAIAIFRDDPLSEQGRAAAAVIVMFGDKNHDVVVRIWEKALPFLKAPGLSKDETSLLLAAFIAGNIDSQLLRGQRKDDSYAGDLQLIETYRQLKVRNSKLNVPEIEKLAEMERRGKLRSYLSSKDASHDL